MALSRLYYTQQNAQLNDTTTTLLVTKSWLYAIKAFLRGEKTGTTGTSGAPPVGSQWTVDYSCDSVTAGVKGDGVDRWGGAVFDGTKIVRGNGVAAHSWFVLTSPIGITALGVSFQLLIRYNSAADTGYSLKFSKNGFTGGTTTVAPTATDEVSLVPSMFDVTAGQIHRIGYVTDANGSFYITARRAGVGIAHAIVGVIGFANPDSLDISPIGIFVDHNIVGRGCVRPGYSPMLTTTGYDAVSGIVSRSPNNSEGPATNNGCGIVYNGNANWYTQTTVNQNSGKQDVLPCIYHFTGATFAGTKGTVPDWWQCNSAKSVGSAEPATGASEHTLYGNVWMPNGGVIPTL